MLVFLNYGLVCTMIQDKAYVYIAVMHIYGVVVELGKPTLEFLAYWWSILLVDCMPNLLIHHGSGDIALCFPLGCIART